jgi:hypothetical protein
MVDNQTSQVLLQDGNSKGDFMNIIVSSDEFYQGLVIDLYKTFLLREPTSQEISEGITLIKNSGNLKNLQKQLLISKEYAGF